MRNDKVDKGFEIFYWKLSYRRRFIRTLWMLPYDLIVVTFLNINSQNRFINTVIPISIIILALIQLMYNYLKWKKTELGGE